MVIGRRKPKQEDEKFSILTSSDEEARAKLAMKARAMTAPPTLPVASSHHVSHGLFQDFGAGMPRSLVVPSIVTRDMTPKELAAKLGISLTTDENPATKPLNLKRNWGELYRNVPDGSYRLAQEYSCGMAFAGTRGDFPAQGRKYAVADATGPSEVKIHDVVIPEEDFRRSDDAVGRIIDREVSSQLLGEANELCAGLGNDRPLALDKALEEVFVGCAMYPAVHFKRRLMRHIGGSHVIRFAIQWVYEPTMDEDDDDDDYDPGVCPECGAHHDGCPPGCGGRR